MMPSDKIILSTRFDMTADCNFQLVYISRATRTLDNVDLDEIAHTASVANARCGVTGLLLYDGTRFIQALEGAKDAVEETMANISRDRRHDSIAYVERAHVSARQFGGWAMDVRRVRDTSDARAFLSDLQRTLRHVADHRLVAAFIGFAVLGRPELRERHAPSSPRPYLSHP